MPHLTAPPDRDDAAPVFADADNVEPVDTTLTGTVRAVVPRPSPTQDAAVRPAHQAVEPSGRAARDTRTCVREAEIPSAFWNEVTGEFNVPHTDNGWELFDVHDPDRKLRVNNPQVLDLFDHRGSTKS